MLIFISFEEMHDYIAEHFDKNLSFSCVNDKELRITFTQRLLFTDVHVNVDVHIDDVKKDEVKLSYKCGIGIDKVVSAALSVIQKKVPELQKGVYFGSHRDIDVKLNEIEKAKPVIENVDLKDISVKSNGLQLVIALK